MKLYMYTTGSDNRLAVATDDQDAYDRRAEVDPAYHYMPVQIEEVIVPGYEITLSEVGAKKKK